MARCIRANWSESTGVDARLLVFDAMPHAFWYLFDLPESREALEAQANFFDRHLG
jgi:epsilon-lactone hydrolase